ncbi:MAG: translation initiation factor IF-2 [Thermoplasmata archaeon]
MKIRQPIVSVLGHVDHGKTSLLDMIRGTTVAEREAGRITQHIGATEVPLEAIMKICKDLVKGKTFKVPGLLFIDTPGHQAFTTLRARGGSLADLAVLVIDISQGIQPQTVESISILKKYKTPFIIALNKLDLVQGWVSTEHGCFRAGFEKQLDEVKQALDEKIYKIIERLYQHGFSSERYDRITDFTKNIALVPVSAKTGEGIPDLLLMLIGLAQRFLEKELETEEGPAEGTILEVKEEKGLGTTLDTIIYSGTISRGDTIVVGGKTKPIVTKVKALLKPKPLDEIRDPSERFSTVKEVSAAAGIKIAAPGLEGVIAGAPLRVAKGNVDELVEKIKEESKATIELDEEGIYIKADAIGSLEALAYELHAAKIQIKRAEVGDISKKDVIDTATEVNPLNRVIIGFNVKVLPDAKTELELHPDTSVILNNIIYKLVEDYQAWIENKKRELEKEKRAEIVHPGMIKILPEHVFRISKPAIVGVRVLAGRIRVDQRLMREDGNEVGKIKSIRIGDESIKEAISGQEVAIAIDGVTVGRQIKVEDILYVDIPEAHARELAKLELTQDEKEVLEKVKEIKSKEKPFWGR